MHHYATAAIREASRLSLSELLADPDLAAGLKYNIMAVGEAARRVSSDLQISHPDIDWRSIIGMRHILSHDYEYVDVAVLWDAANIDAPDLIRILETLLGPAEEAEG
jgi:uncharacterized protein with HEPN domain